MRSYSPFEIFDIKNVKRFSSYKEKLANYLSVFLAFLCHLLIMIHIYIFSETKVLNKHPNMNHS